MEAGPIASNQGLGTTHFDERKKDAVVNRLLHRLEKLGVTKGNEERTLAVYRNSDGITHCSDQIRGLRKDEIWRLGIKYKERSKL